MKRRSLLAHDAVHLTMVAAAECPTPYYLVPSLLVDRAGGEVYQGGMSLPLDPGRYQLDLTHSQIGFVVTHLGLTPIRGVFSRFDGYLDVGTTQAECALDVSVELASLQSSHPGREEHLQGEDFFDSANHPMMLFRSTSIEGQASAWSCAGELTLRGVTAPVALQTELTGRAVFPLDQKEHVGFVGTGNVSRRAFGVAPSIPTFMLSDDITVELSIQLIAPDAR